MSNYGNHIVAFIDILGFKSIVEESSTDKAVFDTILNSLKTLEQHVEYNAGKAAHRQSVFKMTQFSDSIVISRPNTEDALFFMIMDLNFLQNVLAKSGVLIRGGVSYGSLYHENNICFGPAFVKAYELESKHAIYPRIIIDPDIINDDVDKNYIKQYHKYTQQDGSEHIEEKKTDPSFIHALFQTILKQDKDGFYFVDFLNTFVQPDTIEALQASLPIKLAAITGEDVGSRRVRDKLLWMKDYLESRS